MKAWPRSFLAISDMHQTDDNISGAVTQLLLKEPFYAHLLGNLSREISNRTPTLGLEKTQGGYSLIVNPEYFDQVLTTREQRVSAIKHEALHFVFSHVFRGEKYENQEVYKLAADLVVNQYLEPWPSLPDAFTLGLLHEFGVWMNRDESVGYYYAELVKILEENENEEIQNATYRFPHNSTQLRFRMNEFPLFPHQHFAEGLYLGQVSRCFHRTNQNN